MPSSITFSLTLLFLYVIFPIIVQKFFYNKNYPLRTFNLHLSEEIMMFGVPSVVIVIVTSGILYLCGYRPDYGILTAAFGKPDTLTEPLLKDFLTNGINHAHLLSIWICSGIFGRCQARRSLNNGPDKSLMGIIDPWFEVFHRLKINDKDRIMVDVLTKSKILYTGRLNLYLRDRNGELTSLSLTEVHRYYDEFDKEKSEHKDDLSVPSDKDKRTKDKAKKAIPGNQVHFLASDISNINLTTIEYQSEGGSALAYNFMLMGSKENPGEVLKKILENQIKNHQELQKKISNLKKTTSQTDKLPQSQGDASSGKKNSQRSKKPRKASKP